VRTVLDPMRSVLFRIRSTSMSRQGGRSIIATKSRHYKHISQLAPREMDTETSRDKCVEDAVQTEHNKISADMQNAPTRIPRLVNEYTRSHRTTLLVLFDQRLKLRVNKLKPKPFTEHEITGRGKDQQVTARSSTQAPRGRDLELD
jgi:hypothetical protein